jgi:uncharacterized PurR-regulated membrane protein YhhQ (DUF165 family)
MIIIYLMHSVYKKLGKKDMILIGMLFFLCCSLLDTVIYFAIAIYWSGYDTTPEQPHSDEKYEMGTWQCVNYISGFLCANFLFIAVILNINKWIYFRSRILLLSIQKKISSDINVDRD